MRKVYNCFSCREYFEQAKTTKYGTVWEIEVCPFCEGRVYPVKGVRRGLVCLWWWLKSLLVSGRTARW